jgi:hypothetical protein
MTMKILATPLFLLASLSLAVPAIAAPVETASTASPLIDYKNVAAVKTAIADLGFAVRDGEEANLLFISVDDDVYALTLASCSEGDKCGVAYMLGAVEVKKKPTNGWLVRANEGSGVAIVGYDAEFKKIMVQHTFTLNGITNDALDFSVQNTISETNLVAESVSKNEHLKK